MKRLWVLAVCLIFATCVHAGGDPDAGKQKAAPCAACHGADGNSANPAWPKLAGQGEKYLAGQMRLFKNGTRVNALMNLQVENLSEQDIQDIAAYFSSQPASSGVASAD